MSVDGFSADAIWWSFECLSCFHEFGGSGLVFDVRLPASMGLLTAKCPRCGTVCVISSRYCPAPEQRAAALADEPEEG